MIDKVSEIRTVRACDAPPTFDVRIGNFAYAMEVIGNDRLYVHVRCIDTNEIIDIPRDEEITILVPDTWENAKWDISFALMQKGLI